MHYEYAFDSYKAFQQRSNNPDFDYLKNWATEKELMTFAAENCGELVADICKTINSMTGYRKPTPRQKEVIARSLIQKMGSARDVLIAVYGNDIAELFSELDNESAEDEVAKIAEESGIRLSPRRVAFGQLSDFVCKPGDENKGQTYRASVDAVRLMDREQDYNPATALIGGEHIVVTVSELKKLNQEDHDVLTFSAQAMELRDYIARYYENNQSLFAEKMGVNRSKVNLWIKSGWVALNGKLYSSKRDLPKL
ncbi:hypothetical protein [Pantoea sp. BAV 3049]|uniref:hypothetical protein n=1 Tax=Pantoea sp. BAV 3049 TaxID=2654188 RepID=UPI00131BD60C|nr:hypothetical protein [Pantoea sp. BAV 3049]